MATHGELEIRRDQAVQSAAPIEATPAGSLLEVIARASVDPRVDIDKLERLLAMHERIEAQARKERFNDALAHCQSLMPRIDQHGLIDYRTKEKPNAATIPYAKLEDVDACIRPIYTAEGFSVSWDAPQAADGKIRVVGHFKCHGHEETREMTFPPDTGGGKNGTQAVASSVAYGKRQLLKMFFNIIEQGKDRDGSKDSELEPITQNQADDIRTRMNDLPQSAPGVLLSKLCRVYGVERPEDIKKSQFIAAVRDVEATVRAKTGAR